MFADDFYYPTLPLGESTQTWAVAESLLQQAEVDGQAEVEQTLRLNDGPTVRLSFPTNRNNRLRTVVQWSRPVREGVVHCFSAAFRSSPANTNRTETTNPYGSLGLRWLDAKGKRIPVRDRLASRPSTDPFWSHLEIKALPPPGARSARLMLMAGAHEAESSVWFGDLRWGPVQEPPAILELFPRVLRSAEEPLQIRVRRLHTASATYDGRVRVELVDATGRVHRQWLSLDLMNLPWSTTIRLPDASAAMKVRVGIDPLDHYAGHVNWSCEEPVFVARSKLEGRLRDGRMLMDGRPRYLIGAYHALTNDYALLKEAGFNTVITKHYRPEEARADYDGLTRLGLYGMATLGGASQTRGNQWRVQEVVKALRHHKALLAWNLLDEPDRKGIGPREIAWYGVWAQSLAPEIPTTVNLAGPYVFDRFASTVDLFSVDPYPLYFAHGLRRADDPEPDLDTVTRWMSQVRGLIPEGRGFLGVVECFTFNQQWAPPTGEELRNMVFQVLASGACGVMYYSIRDAGWYLPREPLFQEIAAVNREIGRLEPWLVTLPLRGKQDPVQALTDQPDRLVTASWKNGNRGLTVLINLNRAPQTVRLQSACTGVPERLDLRPLEVASLEYEDRSAGLTPVVGKN